MKTHVAISGFVSVLIGCMMLTVFSDLTVNKPASSELSSFTLYSPANTPFIQDTHPQEITP